MTPVAALRRMPAGSPPRRIVHSFGATPPCANSRARYLRPTFAGRSGFLTTVSGCATASLTSTVLVSPSEAVTVTLITVAPAIVGVPETVPVAGSSVRPAGGVDPVARDQVYACLPPVAARARLNGRPTSPAVAAGGVTVSGWTTDIV